MKDVMCPTCSKEIKWSEDFPFRPFCTERCRLIDLGQWADESYRIPTQDGGMLNTESDLEDTSAVRH